MLLRRPIIIWAIFGYSLFVFCYALWAWFAVATGPLYEAYGLFGLVMSIVPAAILFSVGLSMLALTKWAILATSLNLLVAASSFFLVDDALNVTNIVWSAASLVMVIYAIWLRLRGILT